MPPAAVDTEIVIFERLFTLLPETPALYNTWKNLVAAQGIIGKQVHDARLVAICHVYGISHILPFNVAHFLPYSNFGPGLTVVHPKDV